MDLPVRLAAGLVLVDAQHEMFVHRTPVVALELFLGEIPMRIDPVRVARGEEQPLRAVGFGQFLRLDERVRG